MFTIEETQLMRKIGLKFNFDHLTDDEWLAIEENVADYLVMHCLGEDYEPNDEGLICHSILEKASIY